MMRIKVDNIKKMIPEAIKKMIRPIYHKFNIKIDNEILSFLEKYYNLPKKQVLRLLENGGQLSADFWFCQNPKTEQEVKNFYEKNPFYIFNLIYWHSTKEQRNLRHKFIKLAKGRVLDFGAGVGDLCYEIYKKGLKIDYADLQGKLFNFAKKFFETKNAGIKMINLSQEKISDKYDTIFCIDVIEHVLNPKELLKKLTDSLKIDGQLIITALETNTSEQAPMHFEINFDAKKYLISLGMEKTNEFLWIKK